jgi:curved DNA-binding protein CbpA
MPDTIDPYKVLQVDSEAEDEVIQAAYRRLARKYHPDLAATPEAAARMSAINAAWELIGDPAARAAFDLSRTPTSDTRHGSDDRAQASAAKGGAAPSQPRPSTSTPGSGRTDAPRAPSAGAAPEPEIVSPDWTPGRSSQGGGYDESMHKAQGHGAAGPPPGRPSGTVLNFGRYAGWSLGEVARHDLEYIEWLDRAPIGRNYRQEIDEILRSTGRRKSAASEASDRHGLYRRR